VTSIRVRPLRDDLPFGAIIEGVTEQVLEDQAVRDEIFSVFEDRGMIVFTGVEPSNKLQVAISKVFGPLKEHPVKAVDLVDPETMAGAIENKLNPESCDILEIDGKLYSNWLPWHFDHCYNNELNRAGVLRVTLQSPTGGETGFMDGIELYKRLPAELREAIEGRSIVYTMDMQFDHMRFGKPKNFRLVQLDPHMIDIYEQSKTYPRAIHPAVWTRKTGEKVFHLSPWMAIGIEGREDAEGDTLLEAISQEIYKLGETCAYFHDWKPTDMLIWDNWRMLHRVTGSHPPAPRTVQRTTIKGDYGLGRFENGDAGRYAALERTV
jgi:taurine dioxygenase